MMLGMSLSTFTALHVVLSLIGILAGIVWLAALAGARPLQIDGFQAQRSAGFAGDGSTGLHIADPPRVWPGA